MALGHSSTGRRSQVSHAWDLKPCVCRLPAAQLAIMNTLRCRVLLSQPALVLMDESTSALDLENEALLYRLLRQRGITFVSVGHRPGLAEFHEQVGPGHINLPGQHTRLNPGSYIMTFKASVSLVLTSRCSQACNLTVHAVIVPAAHAEGCPATAQVLRVQPRQEGEPSTWELLDARSVQSMLDIST